MLNIGILAGMGPKSTGPFIDEVVSQFQQITGAKDDIDFPPMIIYSLPTPFYSNRPIDNQAMQKTISKGLIRLESCGVDFIAMPCNTAHVYFDALKKCIHVPLLNMIDLTVDSIPPTAKKVTILATRATIESELYQKALEQRELEFALHPKWQKQVDEIIAYIKTDKNPSPQILKPLFSQFRAAQMDTLLLACTDLNVIFRNQKIPFQIVDSSICLAKAIVNQWRKQ